MLSRVADSLYWMSRYLERAEHTARVLGVQLNLMLEQDPKSSDRRWLRVFSSLGHPGSVTENSDPFTRAQTYALRVITGGIASARENARQVREQISSEMWEQLNRLSHEVRRMESAGLWTSQPLDFLAVILESSHLVQGVTDSTMNHGEGWQFIQVGRFIERAAAIARLLDIYFHEFPAGQPMDSGEHMEWIGLLRTCTAFEAYCKVYTADLTYEQILEFLLLDAEFPHSIRYSIDRLHRSLDHIQQESHGHHATELMRVSGKLQASLEYGQVSEILAQDPARYLRRILEQCRQIHDLVYEVYIQYSVQTALAL